MISDSPITKQDLENLENSVNTPEILEKLLLSSQGISQAIYDNLTRKVLISNSQKFFPKNFFDTLQKKLDMNFQNPDFENKTLLMEIISLGLNGVAQNIIENSKINFTLTDIQNENILTKIIISQQELGKDSLFNVVFDKITALSNSKEIINNIGKSGQTPLTLSLARGYSTMVPKLISGGADVSYIVPSTGDNILHITVKGKNPYCLQLILDNVSKDILNKLISTKNLNDELPIQIAVKEKIQIMVKKLKDLEIKEESDEDVVDLLCGAASKEKKTFETIENCYYTNSYNKMFCEYMKNKEKLSYDLITKMGNFFDENIELNKENEIFFFNFLICTYRYCDYMTMLDVYSKCISKCDKSNFIFYFNGILMLLDKSIKLNDDNVVRYLVKKIEEYLNYAIAQKVPNKYDSKCLKYLGKNNIITDVNSAVEILTLYKSYISITENHIEQISSLAASEKSDINNYIIVRYNFLSHDEKNFKKNLCSLSSGGLTSLLFYYNALGIQSIKEKKFTIAEYFFGYCEKLIHKTETTTMCYLPEVLYNRALCYFYTKQYDKCYKLLSSLKSLDTFVNNPFIFYRVGLCCLEKELDDTKTNFYAENLNDIINQIVDDRLVLVYTEQKKCERFEVVGDDDNLAEAILSFKQCLLILKGMLTHSKEIRKLFDKSDEDSGQDDRYKKLYPSVYFNLMFSLLINEDYFECINIAKEFAEYNKKNNLSYAKMIRNYLVEAYIKLGENDKAIEILSKELNEETEENYSFYNCGNGLIFHEVNYKVALYVNMIKVSLLNDQKEEAKKYISAVLKLISYPEKEIPSFVLNIIAYYLIFCGRNDLAFHLLKNRKVPEMIKE